MKLIVYTKPDGGVALVWPIIRNETEDQAIARALKDVPKNAWNPRVIDSSVLPDRSKRRAWRQNGASVVADEVLLETLKFQDAVQAINGMDRLQFEHLFELENRTRVLEGKPQITKSQYRDALIARWRLLNP